MTPEMNLAQWQHEMGIDEQPHATHLVMCPFYDGVQMQALLHRYAADGDTSLVWTKLDEAVCYGALVNVAHEARLPISAHFLWPGTEAEPQPGDRTSGMAAHLQATAAHSPPANSPVNDSAVLFLISCM